MSKSKSAAQTQFSAPQPTSKAAADLALAGVDSQAMDGPRDKEQQDEDDGEAAGQDADALAQQEVEANAYGMAQAGLKGDPAEVTAKAEAFIVARERFEKVSAQFLSGGCSRDALAAAQAELEAHRAVDA